MVSRRQKSQAESSVELEERVDIIMLRTGPSRLRIGLPAYLEVYHARASKRAHSYRLVARMLQAIPYSPSDSPMLKLITVLPL